MKRTLVLATFAFALSLVFLASALAVQPDYLVGEGDVLRIMVYDSPDLNTTTRVGGGSIMFPLLGQVPIEGLTVAQVGQRLSDRLADGYLVNPQVSVFIEEFRSKKAIIMGEIRAPGLYELSGPTKLMELISKAGGLTEDAGESVTIKRKVSIQGSEEQVLNIDINSLMKQGDPAVDVAIMDGDNIYIAKAGVFYVTGEVKRPNSYKFDKGTTLIKAITMAGGFTDLASQKKVKIHRKINGQEQVFKGVSMHTPIKPEDVIVVPESFF